MDENIPTHTLNGVLLVEREDASGRKYFYDLDNKKRAKLDGQEPVPIEAILAQSQPSPDPAPDAPAPSVDPADPVDPFSDEPEESEEEASDHGANDTVSIEVFAVIVAAAFGPSPYASASGVGSAKRVSADHTEVELALPNGSGGEAIYRATLPRFVDLHLTRIR